VRRAGKTTLARSLTAAAFFDCELPRTRRLIEEDPEGFLEQVDSPQLIFDEVHRIANPSELLKIAADHFPELRVLATGSSTLGPAADSGIPLPDANVISISRRRFSANSRLLASRI